MRTGGYSYARICKELYTSAIHADSSKSREVNEKKGEAWLGRPDEPVYESVDYDPINKMTNLRSRAELRGGELCSIPQLSQSLL